MSSSWVEAEAQQQEGFGLHSPDWQRENSLCDSRPGQPPYCLVEQEELQEVEGKSWWQKVLVQHLLGWCSGSGSGSVFVPERWMMLLSFSLRTWGPQPGP